MLAFTIEALLKIALLIGGLMTAAAYFVLLERWMAAWVQDRLGAEPGGYPVDENPPVRTGPTDRRWHEVHFQSRVHARPRR